MSTPISIIGTIATEPRFLTTAGGVQICTFRVASGERRYDRERNAWVDGETNWFTVSAFRGLAEHARDSFAKGDRVVVVGRLRIRAWEREERSGTSVDVEAEALGHDLRWGVSRFTKRTATESDARSSTVTGVGAQVGTDTAPEAEARTADSSAWRPPSDGGRPDAEAAFATQRATIGGEPSADGFVPAAA